MPDMFRPRRYGTRWRCLTCQLGGGSECLIWANKFGGGLKGKAGEFRMKRAMNKMAKQMRKNKKTEIILFSNKGLEHTVLGSFRNY